VRLIDVGPTLLDLAGLPPLMGVSGRSFAPIFDGSTSAALVPEKLLAETTFTHVMPDVFVPEHYVGARRDFLAYRLHPNGLVEIEDETHEQIMLEKDYGAFDGKNWLVTWRNKAGELATRCLGECERSGLRAWFDAQTQKMPIVYRSP
jgi:arylsulfatase A-like enzyme